MEASWASTLSLNRSPLRSGHALRRSASCGSTRVRQGRAPARNPGRSWRVSTPLVRLHIVPHQRSPVGWQPVEYEIQPASPAVASSSSTGPRTTRREPSPVGAIPEPTLEFPPTQRRTIAVGRVARPQGSAPPRPRYCRTPRRPRVRTRRRPLSPAGRCSERSRGVHPAEHLLLLTPRQAA